MKRSFSSIAIVSLVFGVAALTACASTTPEEFAELVEASRACSDSAECVLAGAGMCTCASPVNVTTVDSINEAAADVDCEGAAVDCAGTVNLRCEADRCTGDANL